MGTRTGDMDPAVVLYINGQGQALSARKMNTLLNSKSGVKGVSGISNDMRQLNRQSQGGRCAGAARARTCSTTA